jgi:dTDP-4-amino-4,6-dideoxygalactose transaminase
MSISSQVQVPFLDLPALTHRDRPLIDEAIGRVLDSGWFVLGREVESFEQEFARWCGVDHCVAVGNGLDALILQFKAAGLRPGDEVLVPSHTYIASALGVSEAGLTAVPVECDPDTFSISAAEAEKRITARTRALLVVHLYGRVAPMQALMDLCDRHGLMLFEDCAQSHGARQPDGIQSRCGTFGTAAAFSFYPSKNLGALGDGGAVTTNNAQVAERLRELRNYGSPKKYHHPVKGVNSRLDEVQAAILRARLPLLDNDNARRAEIAAQYLTGIRNPLVTPPQPGPPATHVWHLFVVRVPSPAHRDALASHLSHHGVQTVIHYPTAIHRQGAFASEWGHESLPVAEALAATVISLPIGPTQTDEQTRHVLSAMDQFSMA